MPPTPAPRGQLYRSTNSHHQPTEPTLAQYFWAGFTDPIWTLRCETIAVWRWIRRHTR